MNKAKFSIRFLLSFVSALSYAESYDLMVHNKFVIDHVLQVQYDFIEEYNLARNGSTQISERCLEDISHLFDEYEQTQLGGNTLNAAKAIARMGAKVGASGLCGNDLWGEFCLNQLTERGIVSHITQGDGKNARILCLVTPDGDRSFAIFDGCEEQFYKVPSPTQQAKVHFFTGYDFSHPKELNRMADAIQTNQLGLIAFDLGSPNIVEEFHDWFTFFCNQYVDILFCNEEEAKALAHKSNEYWLEYLKKVAKYVVITMNKEGAILLHGDGALFVAQTPETPLDTTGAGDHFAAGFLWSLINKIPSYQSMEIGHFLAKKIIHHLGNELPQNEWNLLMKTFLAQRLK